MGVVFDEFYKLSMVCLRLNGAHPAVARNWKWALHFSIMHGFFTSYATFCSIHLIFVDVKNRDLPNACSNGIFVIIYYVVSLQYAIMVFYQETIKTMIKYQEVTLVAAPTLPEEDQKIVYDAAKRGRWRSKWWLYSTIVTLLMFPIKRIVQTIYYYYQNQELKLFPINENTYPIAVMAENKSRIDVLAFGYFLFFLYAFYCIMMYTGFTPLGPIFILNTCAQVDLAIKQASNLFAEKEFNRELTSKRIRKLVLDMLHIYTCIEIINQIFSIVFELCLKASAMMIPVAFFLILWVFNHTGELGTDYIMFAITASMLSFEICYYSDIVMEKGEALRQAIYACCWEKHFDSKLRKTLIVMLTRTMTPMAIKTPFRPLCLDTFSELCSQSYTIFNVMNAALN